jgi:serine protease Do
VTKGGPADKAGIKPGDVIRTFNGQPVESSGGLTTMTTNENPGTEVTLGVIRDGKNMDIRMALGDRPNDLSAQGSLGGQQGQAPSSGTLRGISVQSLTPQLRDQLSLSADVHGVVITQVDPNSPAGQNGLQQGLVIESINRQPVNSVADFNRLAAQAKGDTLLRINQQGQSAFVVISPNAAMAPDDGDGQ